jgi:SAM-dependent methyltransferase
VAGEESRAPAELARQFELERALARRLLAASDRRGLYAEAYAELFRSFPRRHDPIEERQESQELVRLQLRLLDRVLRPDTRFVEFGGGDCALAIALAGRVARVTAVEAARRPGLELPASVELVLSDSPPYPLAAGAYDLAFSSHFLEHLHPDDARAHLREVHRLLAPGGVYVCVTPNRLWGPHDVSRYFADRACGLHLREYTHRDLLASLRSAGFRRRHPIRLSRTGVDGLVVRQGRGLRIATAIEEVALGALPVALRRRVLLAVARGTPPPLRRLEQVIVSAERG